MVPILYPGVLRRTWTSSWNCYHILNGIKIMDKSQLVAKECIQLDACLTGCGAWCGTQYYGRTFPRHFAEAKHSIAHLEILNIVVAV